MVNAPRMGFLLVNPLNPRLHGMIGATVRSHKLTYKLYKVRHKLRYLR